MPAHYSRRFPRDLDLAMRCLQVDSSWYENYWLKERKPRPAGMVARNLPTIVSCLRQACHAWPRSAGRSMRLPSDRYRNGRLRRVRFYPDSGLNGRNADLSVAACWRFAAVFYAASYPSETA
jgi:hypothetical protein